ncbi:MAG: hypothetical protein V8R75_01840 [Oscillospiraceae bacterium]
MPEPYYPNYDTFIRVTGATIRRFPRSQSRATATRPGSRLSPALPHAPGPL